MKMSNFTLGKCTVAKCEFAKLFIPLFYFHKKVISPNFSYFYTCKCIFEKVQHVAVWPFPQEEGWDTGLAKQYDCYRELPSKTSYLNEQVNNIVSSASVSA